VTTVTRAAP